MVTVRVVGGTGTGPTAVASYDAALADAGCHEFNVVTVSSVVPADATIEVVDAAPDLGPAGSRLLAVQARATAAGPADVAAGLAWATGEGAGVVYEAAGEDGPGAVELELDDGLAAGVALRDRDLAETGRTVVEATADEGVHVTAVVLAVLGEGQPL